MVELNAAAFASHTHLQSYYLLATLHYLFYTSSSSILPCLQYKTSLLVSNYMSALSREPESGRVHLQYPHGIWWFTYTSQDLGRCFYRY